MRKWLVKSNNKEKVVPASMAAVLVFLFLALI